MRNQFTAHVIRLLEGHLGSEAVTSHYRSASIRWKELLSRDGLDEIKRKDQWQTAFSKPGRQTPTDNRQIVAACDYIWGMPVRVTTQPNGRTEPMQPVSACSALIALLR